MFQKGSLKDLYESATKIVYFHPADIVSSGILGNACTKIIPFTITSNQHRYHHLPPVTLPKQPAQPLPKKIIATNIRSRSGNNIIIRNRALSTTNSNSSTKPTIFNDTPTLSLCYYQHQQQPTLPNNQPYSNLLTPPPPSLSSPTFLLPANFLTIPPPTQSVM